MQPKIIFLGTAGDSFVVGKQLRSSGGIILNVEGYQFHIDPGPGTLVKLKEYNINPRNTHVLFVTSRCLYASNDLNAVIDAMTHHGLDHNGILIATGSVVYERPEEYPALSKLHCTYLEKHIVLEAGNRMGIQNVEIRATKVKNEEDPQAMGLRFLTPQFSLGYIPQTSYFSGLVDAYKDIDIMVVHASFPMHVSSKEGLNSSQVIQLISAIKPHLAIITGFGVKMMQADPLEEARIIQKATNIQTIAAKDGMVVNPISYDINLRQKTLNFY